MEKQRYFKSIFWKLLNKKENMKNIKNQHQQALWYLINWNEFSLLDVIEDTYFVKFQTRLSEIENEYGIITEKKRKEFVNRFGRKSSYNIYKCIDKEKAKELLNKYK